jgi:hypothetical protein
MEAKNIEIRTEKAEKKATKIERLQKLNWEKVQVAGTLFAEALESGTLTDDDLTNLVKLTAKLLEFVAEAREIVWDDTNRVHFAS